MLKDRDYDVTAHIFLILSLTCTPQIHQGSAKECEVDMVGEECEVKMVVEEWPVGRGEVKTWNDARATRANVNAPC